METEELLIIYASDRDHNQKVKLQTVIWTATKSEEEGMILNIAKYKRDIKKNKLPQTVDPLNRTRKASLMLRRLILREGVEGCHRVRYQITN